MHKTRLIRLLGTLALAIPAAGPAYAGGGPGDITSRQASGTHFFGEVKDVAGLAPVEGARVKVAITGTRMFLIVLTDADGRFRLEGFGRDIAASKVQVTCEKSGYRTVEATHRQMGERTASPISIECLIAKQGAGRPTADGRPGGR